KLDLLEAGQRLHRAPIAEQPSTLDLDIDLARIERQAFAGHLHARFLRRPEMKEKRPPAAPVKAVQYALLGRRIIVAREIVDLHPAIIHLHIDTDMPLAAERIDGRIGGVRHVEIEVTAADERLAPLPCFKADMIRRHIEIARQQMAERPMRADIAVSVEIKFEALSARALRVAENAKARGKVNASRITDRGVIEMRIFGAEIDHRSRSHLQQSEAQPDDNALASFNKANPARALTVPAET